MLRKFVHVDIEPTGTGEKKRRGPKSCGCGWDFGFVEPITSFYRVNSASVGADTAVRLNGSWNTVKGCDKNRG